MEETYYDILELHAKASIEEVKKSFKRLALIYHPDKVGTGDRDKFEKIRNAYAFLQNPQKKALYDATIVSNDFDFNDMFSKLVDVMKTKLKSPHPKPKTSKPSKIKVKVSLDDVFKGDIKKVVVRLRRGEGWDKVPFLIDLKEHTKKIFKFPNQGDEEYGVKSDLQIELEVLPNETIKRDNVISENDLYIEEKMSLYEYYCGINREISFLAGETIHVEANGFSQNDFYTYTHTVHDYGLPYIDENNELCYGSLFIYFRLQLPTNISSDHHEMIQKVFS